MQIVCPHCSTGYRLDESTLGPKGRKVRCARCGMEWRAFPVFAGAEAAFGALPPDADAAISAAFTDALLDESGEPRYRTVKPGPPARRSPAAAAAETEAMAGIGQKVIAGVGQGFEPRARRPAGGKPQRRGPPARPIADRLGIPAAVAALLLLAGAILARQPIVAAVPDLAGLYATVGLDVNLRGLEFRNMKATRDIDNGRPILIVEGEIANIAARDAEVPPVRLAVRAGRQEIYAWSVEPARRVLAPGESAAFRTRLASPPAAADDIELRFTPRRQLAAESR